MEFNCTGREPSRVTHSWADSTLRERERKTERERERLRLHQDAKIHMKTRDFLGVGGNMSQEGGAFF